MSTPEIGQVLGKLWNDLSVEDKQTYKNKHGKQMEEFYEKHPEEKSKKKGKKSNN